MKAQVCNHGYWLNDCAICLKRPGECDYGSCAREATTHIETRNAGRLIENRAMCDKHGAQGVLCR